MPYARCYGPAVSPQGWCPSTYRIHEAPDGGIARVRVPGGVLTPTQVRVLGVAARRFGNGIIDLTQRANLQLRGIDLDAGADLRKLLAPVGLSAPTAVTEDRRNVLASPTAGLDGHEVMDITAVVGTIVDRIDALPDSVALPHKVGVLVDGGGAPSLRAITLDLSLGATRTAAGAVVLAVALGTALDDAPPVGFIAAEAGAAADLVEAVLRMCAMPPGAGTPVRVTNLVRDLGLPAVLDLLAPRARVRPATATVARARTTTNRSIAAPLGVHTSRSGHWLCVRPAGPRATGAQFAALADAAVATEAREIRLTPWRCVIVTGVTGPHQMERDLAPVGWTATPWAADPEPTAAVQRTGALA